MAFTPSTKSAQSPAIYTALRMFLRMHTFKVRALFLSSFSSCASSRHHYEMVLSSSFHLIFFFSSSSSSVVSTAIISICDRTGSIYIAKTAYRRQTLLRGNFKRCGKRNVALYLLLLLLLVVVGGYFKEILLRARVIRCASWKCGLMEADEELSRRLA